MFVVLLLIPFYALFIYSYFEARATELNEAETNIRRVLDVLGTEPYLEYGLNYFTAHMDEFVQNADLPGGSLFVLFDADGDIFVRIPDNEKLAGKNISQTALEKVIISEKIGTDTITGQDGVKRLFVFKTLQVRDETEPVYAAIGVPQNEVLVYANLLLERSIVGLGFVTLAVFLIAWFLGNMLLVQRVRALEEVDRIKSDFVSMTSHQLRTPLTAILWNLETLKKEKVGKLNGEQKSFLESALSSVDNLNYLVKLLLDIGRIEAGRLKINTGSSNLVSLTEEAAGEIVKEVNKKSITVEKKMPASLPRVNIDSVLTRQILLNLLSNAVKYTPNGGKIKIEVSKEKENIRVAVIDSGIGIPASEQGRVFSRFFRASNAEGEESLEGTGLGLYFIKLLADKCGFGIGFVSKEGKGSTFWFSIPLDFSLPDN